MQKLLQRILPLGVMTACTIWFGWSELRESSPLLGMTEASLPRLERKLLYPDISEAGERDPFEHAKQETAPPAVSSAAILEPEEPAYDPRTLASTIRLDATMLGATRLAVINGKICAEGDMIVLPDAAEVPVRLDRVLASNITVTIADQTFRIDPARIATGPARPLKETPAAAEPATEIHPTSLRHDIPTPDALTGAVDAALAALGSTLSVPGSPSTESTTTDPDRTAKDEACDLEHDLPFTNPLNEFLHDDQ